MKAIRKTIEIIDLLLPALQTNNFNEINVHKGGLRLATMNESRSLRTDIADALDAKHIGTVGAALTNFVYNPNGSTADNPRLFHAFSGLRKILIETLNAGKDLTVFYSWQSDLPAQFNMRLQYRALLNAAKEFTKKNVFIDIDKDTRGATGAPDVFNLILEKIQKAHVFVADITPVTYIAKKGVPNPNVMIELGYALKHLTASRLVLLLNTAYGKPNDLPFDLGFKRQMMYFYDATTKDKKSPLNELTSDFSKALDGFVQEIVF